MKLRCPQCWMSSAIEMTMIGQIVEAPHGLDVRNMATCGCGFKAQVATFQVTEVCHSAMQREKATLASFEKLRERLERMESRAREAELAAIALRMDIDAIREAGER